MSARGKVDLLEDRQESELKPANIRNGPLAFSMLSARTQNILLRGVDPLERALSGSQSSGFEPYHGMFITLCGIAAKGFSEDMAIRLVLHESSRAFRSAAIPKEFQHEYADQVHFVESRWDSATKFIRNNPPVSDDGEAQIRLGEIKAALPYIRFPGKRDGEIFATLLRLGQERSTISPVIALGDLATLSGAPISTTKAAVRRLEAMRLIEKVPGSGVSATTFFLFVPELGTLEGEYPDRAAPGQLRKSTPGDDLTTSDTFQRNPKMPRGLGLSGAALQVHRSLESNAAAGPLRASTIAEVEMLSESTVRTHLSRMEKLGLVTSIEAGNQAIGRPSKLWVLADTDPEQRDERLRRAAERLGVSGIQRQRELAVEAERQYRAWMKETWTLANGQAWEWRQELDVDQKTEDKRGLLKRVHPEWQWLTRSWFWPEAVGYLAGAMRRDEPMERDEWVDSTRMMFDEVERTREDLEDLLEEDADQLRWDLLRGEAAKRIRRGEDRRSVAAILVKRVPRAQRGGRSGRLKRAVD